MKQNERATDEIQWTTQKIKWMWMFSLEVWQVHNKMEHGGNNGVTLADHDVTAVAIRKYYEEIKQIVCPQKEWLFQKFNG